MSAAEEGKRREAALLRVNKYAVAAEDAEKRVKTAQAEVANLDTDAEQAETACKNRHEVARATLKGEQDQELHTLVTSHNDRSNSARSELGTATAVLASTKKKHAGALATLHKLLSGGEEE